MKILSSLAALALGLSIASASPLFDGSKVFLQTSSLSTINLKSEITSFNTNIEVGQKQNETSTVITDSDFFATLKGYVDGEKFRYEKFLGDIGDLENKWQTVPKNGENHDHVAEVLGDMVTAAKSIVRLFTHENQPAASVIRNMYHFHIILLFNYKVDRSVDDDVSSEAYKNKNSELWDKFKHVRALPRGPVWDLGNENVELDQKLYNILDNLRSKIPGI